jgi:type I restriction enzyme R subunit
METDEYNLRKYKADLKRFQNLKVSVKLRYAESIDYRDYEPKIKKLLDTHIQANEVIQLNNPVNIFDDQNFDAVKQGQGIHSNKPVAARADTIAHATKRVITEKMGEDPTFYEKFSKLIQKAIDDFKARRISDLDYLSKVVSIRDNVVSKKHDDIPANISDNDEACAYYGIIKPYFMKYDLDGKQVETISSKTAVAIQKIMDIHWKVDFWGDDDAQKNTINDIDDFLYDNITQNYDVSLSLEQMDKIIEKTMQIAKNRRS